MSICIDLCGGIGNQLFQWALGRAFQSRGHGVAYTTFGLDCDPGRRLLLPDLGLEIWLTDKHIGRNYTEPNLRFHPEVFSLQGDWTLHGYFQDEKYFKNIADGIRSSATKFPGPNLSEATLSYADWIRSIGNLSCFVHVRRSDNLSERGLAFHGLTSAVDSSYYSRAMVIVRERVPGVHFFVFSDEPQWCKDGGMFCGDDITVVDCNPPSFTIGASYDLKKTEDGREAEDLWLMSICRHAIIANSSFSWWGAWLGDTAVDRVVIAPEPWLASGVEIDIVPDRWKKVPI